MKDRELKRRLKTAYHLTASDREKVFIKKHEKRSMNLKDVFVIEMKYMGVFSYLSGVCVCLLLFLGAGRGMVSYMWMSASSLPVCALLFMSALGRSQRYGMEEFEAASRFSLRFIKMIRMFILGSSSLALILVFALILRGTLNISIFETLLYVGFPYLFNVWGCLLITRKWHARENIYGCVGVTIGSCILPLLLHTISTNVDIPDYAAGAALAIILIVTVKECINYIKGSEDVSWNLC